MSKNRIHLKRLHMAEVGSTVSKKLVVCSRYLSIWWEIVVSFFVPGNHSRRVSSDLAVEPRTISDLWGLGGDFEKHLNDGVRD